jgi:hypothetical protein
MRRMDTAHLQEMLAQMLIAQGKDPIKVRTLIKDVNEIFVATLTENKGFLADNEVGLYNKLSKTRKEAEEANSTYERANKLFWATVEDRLGLDESSHLFIDDASCSVMLVDESKMQEAMEKASERLDKDERREDDQ